MRLFAIYHPVLREIPRKTGLFLCFNGIFRLFSFSGIFRTLHVFQQWVICPKNEACFCLKAQKLRRRLLAFCVFDEKIEKAVTILRGLLRKEMGCAILVL